MKNRNKNIPSHKEYKKKKKNIKKTFIGFIIWAWSVSLRKQSSKYRRTTRRTKMKCRRDVMEEGTWGGLPIPRHIFQGGKTFCASFCASLIAGSRRAFLCVDCVCLLLEFWTKCTRCERLLPVKHFYLTVCFFVVAWKLLWIQNNQC